MVNVHFIKKVVTNVFSVILPSAIGSICHPCRCKAIINLLLFSTKVVKTLKTLFRINVILLGLIFII